MIEGLEVASARSALAGAVLATCSAAFTPVTLALARRFFPRQRVFFARWGFSHVLLAAILYVAIGALFSGALDAASAPLPVQLVAGAGAQGTVCAVVAYWAFKRDPAGGRSLGLWPGRQLRAVAVGLGAYLLTLPGILGLALLSPWLVTRVGGRYEPQTYVQSFPELSTAELWVAVPLAVVVIPLFEELLFRAFLQPLLVQNFRERGGVVLTAAHFAWLHGASAFLTIFGLALLLGAVMLRTQRLLAVWAVHAAHNGLQVLLLLSLPERFLQLPAGLAPGS